MDKESAEVESSSVNPTEGNTGSSKTISDFLRGVQQRDKKANAAAQLLPESKTDVHGGTTRNGHRILNDGTCVTEGSQSSGPLATSLTLELNKKKETEYQPGAGASGTRSQGGQNRSWKLVATHGDVDTCTDDVSVCNATTVAATAMADGGGPAKDPPMSIPDPAGTGTGLSSQTNRRIAPEIMKLSVTHHIPEMEKLLQRDWADISDSECETESPRYGEPTKNNASSTIHPAAKRNLAYVGEQIPRPPPGRRNSAGGAPSYGSVARDKNRYEGGYRDSEYNRRNSRNYGNGKRPSCNNADLPINLNVWVKNKGNSAGRIGERIAQFEAELDRNASLKRSPDSELTFARRKQSNEIPRDWQRQPSRAPAPNVNSGWRTIPKDRPGSLDRHPVAGGGVQILQKKSLDVGSPSTVTWPQLEHAAMNPPPSRKSAKKWPAAAARSPGEGEQAAVEKAEVSQQSHAPSFPAVATSISLLSNTGSSGNRESQSLVVNRSRAPPGGWSSLESQEDSKVSPRADTADAQRQDDRRTSDDVAEGKQPAGSAPTVRILKRADTAAQHEHIPAPEDVRQEDALAKEEPEGTDKSPGRVSVGRRRNRKYGKKQGNTEASSQLKNEHGTQGDNGKDDSIPYGSSKQAVDVVNNPTPGTITRGTQGTPSRTKQEVPNKKTQEGNGLQDGSSKRTEESQIARPPDTSNKKPQEIRNKKTQEGSNNRLQGAASKRQQETPNKRPQEGPNRRAAETAIKQVLDAANKRPQAWTNRQTPEVVRKWNPAAESKKTPESPNKRTPDTANKGTPGTANKGTPGTANKGTPGTANKGTPGMANKRTPDATNKRTPDATNKRTPDTANKLTPDTANKRADSQSNTQVPNRFKKQAADVKELTFERKEEPFVTADKPSNLDGNSQTNYAGNRRPNDGRRKPTRNTRPGKDEPPSGSIFCKSLQELKTQQRHNDDSADVKPATETPSQVVPEAAEKDNQQSLSTNFPEAKNGRVAMEENKRGSKARRGGRNRRRRGSFQNNLEYTSIPETIPANPPDAQPLEAEVPASVGRRRAPRGPVAKKGLRVPERTEQVAAIPQDSPASGEPVALPKGTEAEAACPSLSKNVDSVAFAITRAKRNRRCGGRNRAGTRGRNGEMDKNQSPGESTQVNQSPVGSAQVNAKVPENENTKDTNSTDSEWKRVPCRRKGRVFREDTRTTAGQYVPKDKDIALANTPTKGSIMRHLNTGNTNNNKNNNTNRSNTNKNNEPKELPTVPEQAGNNNFGSYGSRRGGRRQPLYPRENPQDRGQGVGGNTDNKNNTGRPHRAKGRRGGRGRNTASPNNGSESKATSSQKPQAVKPQSDPPWNKEHVRDLVQRNSEREGEGTVIV